jgi:hypothetical protein
VKSVRIIGNPPTDAVNKKQFIPTQVLQLLHVSALRFHLQGLQNKGIQAQSVALCTDSCLEMPNVK